MNVNVELYIENLKVDLDESVRIPITKQIEDISDPGAIKNTFSKTITVPNTPNNNIIFGQIWNNNKIIVSDASVTNIGFNFNPSKKANFRLMYNNTLFQSGYIKLSEINQISPALWRYEVNLFGDLGTFIGKMGDDSLIDTLGDSSIYNQYFQITAGNLKNLYLSQQPGKKSRFNETDLDTFYNASNTLATNLDNSTYYNDKLFDIIDSENGLYNISNKVEYIEGENTDAVKVQTALGNDYTETYMHNKLDYKQRFGLYTDYILNSIVEKYGYTIDWGQFKQRNNAYWYNLLVTSPLLTSKDTSLGQFITDSSAANNLSAGDYSNNVTMYNYNIIKNDFDIDVSSNHIMFPNDDTISKFYNVQITNVTGNWNIGSLPSAASSHIWFSANDDAKIQLNFWTYPNDEYNIQFFLTTNAIATASNDNLIVEWRAYQYAGTTQAYIEVLDREINTWCRLDTYLNKYMYEKKINFLETNDFYLFTGLNKFHISTDWIKNEDDTILSVTSVSLNGLYKSRFVMKELSDIQSYSIVKLKQLLPNLKTKDFFLGYLKMFGLNLKANEPDKKINIKTKNELYKNNIYLDWSAKLCRDRDIKTKPLTFNKSFLRLGFKKSDMYLNKLYTTNTAKSYGETKINLGYEFDNSEFDILNSPFEHIVSKDLRTTFCGQTDTNTLKKIPVIAKESSDKLQTYNPISFIFMNGNKTIPASFYNNDVDKIYFNFTSSSFEMVNNNEFIHNKNKQKQQYYGSQIKFYKVADVSNCITPTSIGTNFFYKESGDCFPDMSNVTHSLCFSKPAEVYYTVTDASFPSSSTIYERGWKKWIEDRYNVNTRILTAYFYLTPLDVLNFDFGDFVMVDHTIYVVNKIKDFDITLDQPVQVELVKVNDVNNYKYGQNFYDYLKINSLELDDVSIYFPYNASTGYLDVLSNVNWLTSDNQTWLTVDPSAGSDNYSLVVSVSENEGYPRNGVVTVTNGTLSAQATVYQGPKPFLYVDPSVLTFGKSAATKTFDIKGTVTWDSSSNQSWMSINQLTGSGDGSINVSVAAYDSSASRSGVVRVQSGSFVRDVSIMQQTIITTDTSIYLTPGSYVDKTVPAGCTQMIIECWGGGGAGGGVSGPSSAGGGAGGQYAKKTITNPTAGHAIFVKVAAAKTGTTADAGAGDYSYVSVNSTQVCNARGGAGTAANIGGLGSVVDGLGDTIYKGGDGANAAAGYGGGGGGGASSSGNGTSAFEYTGGGNGGSGADGGGDASGYPGGQPGGGGGGSFSTDESADYPGGDGAEGKVIITYTIED